MVWFSGRIGTGLCRVSPWRLRSPDVTSGRRRRERTYLSDQREDRGGDGRVSRRETSSADLPTGWEGTKVRGVSPVGSGGKNHFRS